MDRLWGVLGDKLSRWTLVRQPLPPGVWGLTRYEEQQVVIADDLSCVEAHCTLVHELVHVHRGPPPPGWEAQEEHRVSTIAARKLLPDLAAVADALVWADWRLHEAAEELDVDEDTLRWRLKTLTHPAEVGYMKRRFAEGEDHEA